MHDRITCPICANKLKNINMPNKFLPTINHTANYIARNCSDQMNHTISFYFNEDSNQVDFLKLSLDPKYSKYLHIDFLNKKSRISCYKDGKIDYINIPKMITPDFPMLTKLKEKVALFVTFS